MRCGENNVTTDYKDLIKIEDLYHYSVNIRYDLDNTKKIKAFIPTPSNVNILKKLLLNTLKREDKKANVLIGPYGKGKSYILLVLLYILSPHRDLSILSDLKRKIKKIDSEVADLIDFIVSEEIRYLPVILNYNYRNPEQAFLVALKDAMERENLENLKFPTSFEMAIETIKKWKADYPEAYCKFESLLSEINFTVEDFIEELKSFNFEVYEYFTKLYSDITAGAQFNALLNDDFINTYRSFMYKLREEGIFDGIYVVFDEFSKFVEEEVRSDVGLQLKTIQDMAELVERDTERAIQFTCIMHKPFDHYLKEAKSVQIDLFRTVEGRFQEIYFISPAKEEYEVIGQVVRKDELKFNVLWENCGKEVTDLYFRVKDLFRHIYDEEGLKNLAKECFPFNPVSLFVLPRLCELVAQNERTLFTFLTSHERGGFLNFIEKRRNPNEGFLLNLDVLFDYFEISFRKEIFNKKVVDIYNKAQKSLALVEDENEKRIIKALAVIYIVDELERLEPKEELLLCSLEMSRETFERALEALLEKKVLIKRRSTQYIEFFLSSNGDLYERINFYKSAKGRDLKSGDVIGKIKGPSFIFPRKYNDEHEITRYFYKIFLEAHELERIDSYQDLWKTKLADGYIIHLLWQNEDEIQRSIEKVKRIDDERILLCVPKDSFDKLDEIKEYVAIQLLMNEAREGNNAGLLYDLELLLEDLENLIANYIDELFEYEQCSFYNHKGELLKIEDERDLNNVVNDICREVYKSTPIVPNEMVNKNNLTPQMQKALANAIKYLLEGKIDEIKGNKPEKTILKVAVVNKGLLDGFCKDAGLRKVLEAIDVFMNKASKEKTSFGEIYSVLQGKGYGMRKGIIPIYLAYKMRDLIEDMVFYFGSKEIDFDEQLFIKINEEPESYYLFCDSKSVEKKMYLKSLTNLFKDYMRDNEQNIYFKIYDAMRTWYISLPPFTQKTNAIEIIEEKLAQKTIRSFKREIANAEQNPFEFISKKLLSVLGCDTYSEAIVKIEKLKKAFDAHLELTVKEVIKNIKDILGFEQDLNILVGLKKWYFLLPKTVKEVFHGEPVNSFLKYIDEVSEKEEMKVVSDLSLILLGIDIAHWDDSSYGLFIERLKEVVNTLAENEKSENTFGFFKISFSEEDKEMGYKMLEKIPISETGKVLKTAIEELLVEFGAAIDEKEKLNILVDIIKERLN
ncbi:hypothetical protein SAMN02745221_01887 [Thermosyntropha lipolytica DSM 11003]|uniref:Uncharacterized protein n=1 Tax=Thermosyntropha lipolytica DSM 11003 TaxID=1123382 RepID=A0A1M5QYJ2_9FIRM|nr:hypothetical protein [Thermosyntropha lipolytica]SHH18948.1 hypothetical protein SAMN02745221_01887 [Thermosyntropha lipolytica DSM 11003]